MIRPNRRREIASGYRAISTDSTVGFLDGYENSNGIGYGMRARRMGRNYTKFQNSGELEFSLQGKRDDYPRISSPPLWKTSPPTTPRGKDLGFQCQLSPNSRSKAIAKSRQEMMELVDGMPESDFELSLRDLVELPLNEGACQSAQEDEKRDTKSEAIKNRDRKKEMMTAKKNKERAEWRRRKVESEPFLLKMFLPAAFGSKKKSRRSSASSKVSPKPLSVEAEKNGYEKSMDVEWWKKKYSPSEESENRRGSSSGGRSTSSINSGHIVGLLPGCVSFLSKKSKPASIKGTSSDGMSLKI